MSTSRFVRIMMGLGACVSLYGILCLTPSQAQQPANEVAIDNDDIGGVVNGPKGTEAGVWVIAETRDLPVRFIKSVVTDDRGRFVVPDLPSANYSVWARGYGLVDSPKTTAKPGQRLTIAATPAPNEAAAAHYYPAIYWYSMLKIPDADQFGGKNPGVTARLSQTQWISAMKNTGCVGCHQLGQQSTRTIPAALGTFASGADAWKRRVQSGQSGQQMLGQLTGLGEMSFANYGDWTDRIAKGELPFAKPPRPQGAERNIVVTLRDWMNDKQYLHDLIASDRRYPTVNAYGPIVGSPEYSSDVLPILDPVKNVATTFKAPVKDPNMPLNLGPGHAAALDALQPSPYWGSERIWETRVNNHNSMFGRDGRVWLAASVRGAENPAFCKAGSDHPSAKAFPMERAVRHITVFDLKTQKYSFVDTCFSTHHLQFGYDSNETLWTSGGGPVVGWVNTKMFDQTGDAAKSQGWTALVLDTNGNGKRDAYTEPDQPMDPTKDMRINSAFYAVMPNPADGSIWGATLGVPGAVVRLSPGSNPPETALAEVYRVPMPGFGARGADIDSKGVVWVSLGSGHMGSFDRRKCKAPLNGPKATGDHCPEGWTFHQYPGPGFRGIGENSAESSYYSWVDQHNTFGLGNDVPMSTGNLNDGIIAYANGRMVVLRVPYPMGFYAKGFDGRIDDPKAGWKGRGLWAANGDRTPWLIEGGKGNKPLAAHFQLRPDPLAK
ncbi:MAG TPA: carboxypeptidase-like regulatory domain-containing protein [Vicinamibacterales bacterium]|nr:carboxypeptidase-like regulatory domain-containing protein [Vicinamibacterales bacterium]